MRLTFLLAPASKILWEDIFLRLLTLDDSMQLYYCFQFIEWTIAIRQQVAIARTIINQGYVTIEASIVFYSSNLAWNNSKFILSKVFLANQSQDLELSICNDSELIATHYIPAEILQMTSKSPQLTLEHLQQLSSSVQAIIDENKATMDEVLSRRVQIETASILKLYHIATEQWTKKQNLLSSLSTLFLTLAEAAKSLLEQHAKTETSLLEAQFQVENLQLDFATLREISKQKQEENEKYKAVINEYQGTIASLTAENLILEQSLLNSNCKHTDALVQADSASLAEERTLFTQQSSQLSSTYQLLAQRQSQISELEQERQLLQRKLEEQMEENQLARVEIELAEMAVKDAFACRDTSFSCHSDHLDRSDEIYTTKSHAQFMNGELECLSRLDDSFQFTNKEIIPSQDRLVNTVNPEHSHCQNQGEESFELKLSSNEETTSPFKKKSEKLRRYRTEVIENEMEDSFRGLNTMLGKDKKTVALQCNLLKNVPKIRLFTKQSKQKNQSSLEKGGAHGKNGSHVMNQSLKVISKSEMMGATSSSDSRSFTKLMSFFSSKIITNRIRVK